MTSYQAVAREITRITKETVQSRTLQILFASIFVVFIVLGVVYGIADARAKDDNQYIVKMIVVDFNEYLDTSATIEQESNMMWSKGYYLENFHTIESNDKYVIVLVFEKRK